MAIFNAFLNNIITLIRIIFKLIMIYKNLKIKYLKTKNFPFFENDKGISFLKAGFRIILSQCQA